MPLDELKSALTQFVSFARGLRGDEKSEAQTFLDHFFRALGHKGVIEAGATFEHEYGDDRVFVSLADATQQLYLGLPSIHEERIRGPWSSRSKSKLTPGKRPGRTT